jgi:hypothetical protein
MFGPKAFKCVMKMNTTNFNSFVLLIINIVILFNFEKNDAHLIRKKIA